MHIVKHGVIHAICVIFLLNIFTCQSFAINTSATSSVLIDAGSGRVLYEDDADREMLIASTTKIMTAIVALERSSLSDIVEIKREYTLAEGSSMYLKEGETLTMETLLYGLMLSSGNDAALAVAGHCAGSVETFVGWMNDKARELGLFNTSFANPNGLDDEAHYSSARDMARLASYAMENEDFRRIVSTISITIEGRTFTNHNKLLRSMDGCIGLKTGYTRAAGRTLVSCVERDGHRLIAVTLQDGNDWADHEALYEYGFSTYTFHSAATAFEKAGSVLTEGGQQPQIPVLYAESFVYPLLEGEVIRTELLLPEFLSAPVSLGETVGQAVFYLQQKEVGRVDLIAGEEVLPQRPRHLNPIHRFFDLAPTK